MESNKKIHFFIEIEFSNCVPNEFYCVGCWDVGICETFEPYYELAQAISTNKKVE